jgi:hypothetical protein
MRCWAAVLFGFSTAAATSTVGAENFDASTTLGVIMHTHGTPEQLQPVMAAGISIIRTDMSWATLEPTPGHYNFSTTDQCAFRGLALHSGVSPSQAAGYEMCLQLSLLAAQISRR